MSAPLSRPAPGVIGPPAPALPSLVTSVTLKAPLIGIESARLALQCSENQLMEWIGSGQLEWAFDLGTKEAPRAYTRILTHSVVKLQQARAPGNVRRRCWKSWIGGALSFDQVFDSVFRHHRPWIRSAELVWAWNCCPNHVANLIELDFLEIAKKRYYPKQARLVSRRSIAAFMQQRKMH